MAIHMQLKLKGFLDRVYWASPWGRLHREKINRLYEAASARGLAGTLEKVRAERDLYLSQRNALAEGLSRTRTVRNTR